MLCIGNSLHISTALYATPFHVYNDRLCKHLAPIKKITEKSTEKTPLQSSFFCFDLLMMWCIHQSPNKAIVSIQVNVKQAPIELF